MGHPTVPLLAWILLTIVGGVAGMVAVARGALTGLGRSDESEPGGDAEPTVDGRDESGSAGDTEER